VCGLCDEANDRKASLKMARKDESYQPKLFQGTQ